jgi:hypothetical protein
LLRCDLSDRGKTRLHAKMPSKNNSVNCGISVCACRFPSGLYH